MDIRKFPIKSSLYLTPALANDQNFPMFELKPTIQKETEEPKPDFDTEWCNF